MSMAGNTGTTQIWGDAWTVGFSPYMTTAVWFGFDTPGNSLGRELTGATAAGPVWAEYMKKVHSGLEAREFERPSGIVTVRVCADSGMLPTKLCPDTVEEIFIAGTQPNQLCTIHSFEQERDDELVRRLQDTLLIEDFNIESDSIFSDIELPSFDSYLDFTGTGEDGVEGTGQNSPDFNPLLD
jgi:penicillin-binding protein 1A